MKVGAVMCLTIAVAVSAFGEGDSSDRLYQAIRNNSLTEVQALLAGGVDVNSRDKRKTTPLMQAAAFGSVDAMRLLIEAGADVNAENAFDATALMWAVNDINKVRLLLGKGADVNAKSKLGRTALHMASADGSGTGVVRLLLEKGAVANARDAQQSTPLIEAANSETAKLLIDKGADVNAKTVDGTTPLMNAVGGPGTYGDVSWIKMLLDKGADVNAASKAPSSITVKNGPIDLGAMTPLMLAVAFDSREAVKVLLDAGANVNAKDMRGMTPVMLAIASDHNDPEVVKLLVSHGANLKVKSKVGEDAQTWAQKFDRADTVVPVSERKTDLKPAVQKSLDLLQRTNSKFMIEGGCVSCHAQNLTALAIAAVRTKGLKTDAAAEAEQLKATKFQWAYFEQPMLQRLDPPGQASMIAYSLFAMAADRYDADVITDAMLFNLAAEQREDGSWDAGGVARPPIQDGPFSDTALCARSLQLYSFAGRKPEFDERIARAKAWMERTEARTTLDRAMQLLGLKWTGADPAKIQQLAKALIGLQRADGSWAQTSQLPGDAYATGQILYALNVAGMPASDPAYRRGIAYLLSTQLPDGSWHVASRAPKFQPYFQSGFPHNHDQWISSAGTAWAVIALSAGIEESRMAGLLPE
ncbi:MAG TPA: ankyrin repeat domain-containing protein [Bryobacteraceae bacterium]|nr:ankyrin repeat domain-containing protein [Bryobacteraceae bacterium]